MIVKKTSANIVPKVIIIPLTTSVYTTEYIPAITVYDIAKNAVITIPFSNDIAPSVTIESTLPPPLN